MNQIKDLQQNSSSNVDLKKLKILWFAFFSAIAIYNIIAFIMSDNGNKGISESLFLSNDNIFELFYISIVVIAIQFFIYNGYSSKIQSNPLIQNKQGAYIVKYAASEFAAICGLMLFFYYGNLSYLFSLSVLSMIEMLLFYPKE